MATTLRQTTIESLTEAYREAKAESSLSYDDFRYEARFAAYVIDDMLLHRNTVHVDEAVDRVLTILPSNVQTKLSKRIINNAKQLVMQ